MKQSTVLSLSKKIVLAAAALFSVTAFAATCPEINEIHPSQTGMQWVTDSGWVSTSPPTSGHPVPSKFISAYIVRPSLEPASVKQGTFVGDMVCRYESKTTSAPVVSTTYITLERPHSIASVTFAFLDSEWAYKYSEYADVYENTISLPGEELRVPTRVFICTTSCDFDLKYNVVSPF